MIIKAKKMAKLIFAGKGYLIIRNNMGSYYTSHFVNLMSNQNQNSSTIEHTN